jgi:osmoprotectant transport system permease protein
VSPRAAGRLLVLSYALLASACRPSPSEVRVGSKKFTESVILGEIVTQVARSSATPAVHRAQLGGTQVLWRALLSGDIDIYPEYTGTIREEILKAAAGGPDDLLRDALAAQGIVMTESLGFEDSYALGMRETEARRLGLRTISDLRSRPELRLGFSEEFLHRPDGWPALQARYGLPQTDVRPLDHDIAYRALATGVIDVMDLYSTDAEIAQDRLEVLADDLRQFPQYRAVLLHRADLARRFPSVIAALERLEGTIDERQMRQLNARAKIERVPERLVAADFLESRLGIETREATEARGWRIARAVGEHLALVAMSLSAAIVVAIPLGVAAARRRRLGAAVLAVAGLVQTIPSLALLVFMIPLLGIGTAPAVAALFLYSLLPIVRNTATGLAAIPAPILESADVLGLSSWTRLRMVELPLASPSIMAGIQTSAVINVGTATLGALIGAGGLGQPILTGIRLDDRGLILEGAVPAAVLALLVQGAFTILGKVAVPKGLRLKPDA